RRAVDEPPVPSTVHRSPQEAKVCRASGADAAAAEQPAARCVDERQRRGHVAVERRAAAERRAAVDGAHDRRGAESLTRSARPGEDSRLPPEHATAAGGVADWRPAALAPALPPRAPRRA